MGGKKAVVLGVGNLLLSDEGVGIHVVKELMEMDLPPGVSVVDGGTHGFGLLDFITDADRLIIIDAVKGGGEPGTVYTFKIDNLENHIGEIKLSVHQFGILEMLNLATLFGRVPETTVIGIEPKSVDFGTELSYEVRSKIHKVIELVMEELKNK